MMLTAVFFILLLAFISENCQGKSTDQVLVNNTRRMIHQSANQFGHDYIDFTLRNYLYGNIPFSIKSFLECMFLKKEINKISVDLAAYMKQKQVKVQPPMKDIFNAFQKVGLWQLKVVILGQDPTPIEGEATGMAFSLKPTSDPTHVSTGSILRLLKNRGYKVNLLNGDLTSWAEQGVLLLNSALTITVGFSPDSEWHQNLWRSFTIKMINRITLDTDQRIVWMLWGNVAQSFRRFIDEPKHLVLTSVHPSPKNGDKFEKQANDIFGQANMFLIDNKQDKIDWNLA